MPQNTDDTGVVMILLVLIGAFVIVPMFVMGVGPMMGGMWDGHMWGDGMTGWVSLVGIGIQLLFLAAIIGGGYLIYRAVAGSESDPDQALEALRLAYARGELTDEEYEQRREALERDMESP